MAKGEKIDLFDGDWDDDEEESVPVSTAKGSILSFFGTAAPAAKKPVKKESKKRKRKQEAKTTEVEKDSDIDDLFQDTDEPDILPVITKKKEPEPASKKRRKPKKGGAKNATVDDDGSDLDFKEDVDTGKEGGGKRKKLSPKERAERQQTAFLGHLETATKRACALLYKCGNETSDIYAALSQVTRAGNVFTNAQKILTSMGNSVVDRIETEMECTVEEWRQNNMLLDMIEGDGPQSDIDHVEKSEFDALTMQQKRALLGTYVTCAKLLPVIEKFVPQLKFIVTNLKEKKRLAERVGTDLKKIGEWNRKFTDSMLKQLEEISKNGSTGLGGMGMHGSVSDQRANTHSLFKSNSAHGGGFQAPTRVIPQGFLAMKHSVVSMPSAQA